jgi:hypothetical protein
MLACLNVGASVHQQFGDCSGRRGAERQNIAATFYAACRRLRLGWRLGVHRLAGADDARSPPCGGGDNKQTR